MATTEQSQTVTAPRHVDEADRAWRDAVAVATRRALDFYGEPMAATIARAMDIVLNGDLRLDPIGTGGQVRSQTHPGKIYTVGQYCECLGSHFRPDEDLCKHVLALRIHQRALTLKAQFAPQRELPEAPISLNIHLTIQGQLCQLTLRGFHCTEVIAEFERLMRQFQAEAPAASAPPQATLAVAAPTPPSAPPTLVPPAVGAERPPLCPKHQQEMKPSKFDGGGFYCTKKEADGSYCKAKV